MENNDLDTTVLESLTKENDIYIGISKNFAKDVLLSQLKILDVIQKLQCLLLSESVPKRDMGVLILSTTLQNLEQHVLNAQELSVLSSYFIEKLKDHHQVASSALKGVLSLVLFNDEIPKESVIDLVSCIFQHITCQQQQQPHRYLIYEIFETVLKQHLNAVESMGIDFVYGVISSIDGERDPKNLIYLFSWLQRFLKTVKLGHLSEEMFDVLSCYFPVDFKAPPSNNTVAREDLAKGLGACLTATPDFGELAISLALEKLDSTLRIAKEDSLGLLRMGCKNFDYETYYKYSIELWSQIQKEIFSNSDIELRHYCLETLMEIIRKLSLGDEKNFENLIYDITDTLQGNLLPESKLFLQSFYILNSVAKASSSSSLIIIKKILPLLENTFKMATSHRASILNVVVELVKTTIQHEGNSHRIPEEISCCYNLFCQTINDPDQNLCVEGYKGLSAILSCIPHDALLVQLKNLSELLSASLPDKVKEAVLGYFYNIAKTYPEETRHLLENDVTPLDTISHVRYLESLDSIVMLPNFKVYVMEVNMKCSLNNIKGLKHLNELLTKNCDGSLVKILIEKDFLNSLMEQLQNHKTCLENNYLQAVRLLISAIVREQEAESQSEVYSLYSNRNFELQTVNVAALSGLIVPLRRGVFSDYSKIGYLLENLKISDEIFIKETCAEVIGNLLNKITDELVLEENLCHLSALCINCETEIKILLTSWISRALVTRNHPKASLWIDNMIAILEGNLEAAKGFKILLNDSNRSISKENFCEIMPLYKQKVFHYCINKFNETRENSEAHLNAVGYLLEDVSKIVLLSIFQKALRLILQIMERSQNYKVLKVILQRITDFIQNGEQVIEDNLDDILTRILKLTTFNASMSVRIAALRCLHQMVVSYKVYKLLPMKFMVIEQLGICVDDRKRLVRIEAMECRSSWFLLDAPI
ncbi:hypothetical protein ABEB36_012139 [Hypothenemus hampei]|uniref:MMS19 nucleotide excision repair protein n=1 Tax=Hypothenemus hampei TaxID=57062 RepID=A0ABD1EEI9_HYPHA